MNPEPDLNPDDLADLAAAGEEVLRHEDRHYLIVYNLPGMKAVDFIETYHKAVNGDSVSTQIMAAWLHEFAERLYQMMEIDDDEVDDYNAQSDLPFLFGDDD